MVTGTGDQQVTVEFSSVGVAEVVVLFGSIERAVPVNFGNRTGNGDITKTGLVNGTIYELWGQIESLSGGPYGVASPSIFLVPRAATAAVSNCRLSAWTQAIRGIFVNSTNFLAWIQSVNVGETATGHVFLGFDPRLRKQVKDDGPVVNIYPSNFESANEFSAGTYRETFDVVSDVQFFVDQDTPSDWLSELDFLCAIIDEFKAKKTALESTFQGEITRITMTGIDDDLNQRNERLVTIRMSVLQGVTS